MVFDKLCVGSADDLNARHGSLYHVYLYRCAYAEIIDRNLVVAADGKYLAPVLPGADRNTVVVNRLADTGADARAVLVVNRDGNAVELKEVVVEVLDFFGVAQIIAVPKTVVLLDKLGNIILIDLNAVNGIFQNSEVERVGCVSDLNRQLAFVADVIAEALSAQLEDGSIVKDAV